MIIEISGKCKNCGSDYKNLVDHGKSKDPCQYCGEQPFDCKIIEGIIYIVSNPNQTGVKIGYTNKPIHERLKGLNSTGVPGEFGIIAIFPSAKAKVEEKKVHKKLIRYNLSKEHFDLDPIDAVLKASRELKRDPIFYNKSYEEAFNLKREQARIDMKIRLQGKGKLPAKK
ncbi:MAG: GIY-YIG nuclease family protein [Holosporaceae bacterium]